MICCLEMARNSWTCSIKKMKTKTCFHETGWSPSKLLYWLDLSSSRKETMITTTNNTPP